MCVCACVRTHRVDRECNVSKAPGFIEVIWLSYRDKSRTELRPTKLLLLTQLMRLLLNMLQQNRGEADERGRN